MRFGDASAFLSDVTVTRFQPPVDLMLAESTAQVTFVPHFSFCSKTCSYFIPLECECIACSYRNRAAVVILVQESFMS